MFPSRIDRSHAPLQVMPRQNCVQAAVDLVQFLVEPTNRVALRLKPLSDSREPRGQHGHGPWSGLILEGFLPFLGVLIGAGVVEGDVCFIDFVVEVVLEDAVLGVGFPLVEDEQHLVGDGSAICKAQSLQVSPHEHLRS